MVIAGGESHKTGQGGDTAERVARLERWARERFDVRSIEYRWSTQDNMPVDGVPFIGRLAPFQKRIWVATGFMKWGLTNGTAAGMILTDLIGDRENPWAALFDSTRFKPLASARELVKENANVGVHFVGDHLGRPDVRSVDELGRARPASCAAAPARSPPTATRTARCTRSRRLHAPRLPGEVERGRAQLGLPLPRLALRLHRPPDPGAGGEGPRGEGGAGAARLRTGSGSGA